MEYLLKSVSVEKRLLWPYFFLGVIFFLRLFIFVYNPFTCPTGESFAYRLNNQLVGGFQKKLDLALASFLPSKEAGLLSGIVFGMKKSLPPKLYQQMKQTGTLHIAVASGMNITLMVIPIFGFLTIFLKRKTALIPLTILIWFYALLTGFQPPIVRASIMVSLIFFAEEFGRKADNVRILLMTGYVMVFINPAIIFDLSFQLSFSSILGLIFIQPILKKSSNGLIRSENFSSTLACQIATLPIIMINFGEYNLLSPVINLLLLWSVPYILGLGLLAALFNFVSGFIAGLLALFCYPILWYFSHVLEICAKLKIFQVWAPKWGVGMGMVYYLMLGWLVYKKKKPRFCN